MGTVAQDEGPSPAGESPLPAAVLNYLAVRDAQRYERAAAMWAALDEMTQRLVREAAVMGYVQGAHAGGGEVKIPTDREIVIRVLSACDSLPDLYPTLSGLATGPAR